MLLDRGPVLRVPNFNWGPQEPDGLMAEGAIRVFSCDNHGRVTMEMVAIHNHQDPQVGLVIVWHKQTGA